MDRPIQARRRLLALSAVAVVASVAITACSTGSSSSSGTSSASAAATGGTSASSATAKSPFKFFFLETPLTGPDNAAGVKTAVAAINAAGGVDGHPLEYTTCSDNTDPNGATTCARQGISD